MIRSGENRVNGIAVFVTRRRARHINLRVKHDGTVHLTVPYFWATLADAEAFLLSKWDWVMKTRQAARAQPVAAKAPVGESELASLKLLLAELQSAWMARLGEPDVAWKLRTMTSIWGSCHWRKRLVTYNTELARKPRELVEYVVVHELTHLQAHDHGPHFKALMDARLPDWRRRRDRLNHPPPATEPVSDLPPPERPDRGPVVYVQGELW